MADQAQIERAWAEFRRGALGEAEQLAVKLLKSGQATLRQVPLAQIRTTRAALQARAGESAKALALLQWTLHLYHDDPYAQELTIAVLREAVANAGERRRAQPGRIVLGMGTGRSGSTSLTALLQAQSGTYSAHEHPPLIPWDAPGRHLDFHHRRLGLLALLHPVVADSSHWWLPGLERTLKFFPNLRAVVLRRDKEATVASFLKLKHGGGKGSDNHWVRHDGSFWKHSEWDICYPTFEARSMEEALGLYWDHYIRRAEALAEAHPANVAIFPTESLSDPDGQRRILEFCGYTDPVLPGAIQENRGQTSDGAYLWPNPLAD